MRIPAWKFLQHFADLLDALWGFVVLTVLALLGVVLAIVVIAVGCVCTVLVACCVLLATPVAVAGLGYAGLIQLYGRKPGAARVNHANDAIDWD